MVFIMPIRIFVFIPSAYSKIITIPTEIVFPRIASEMNLFAGGKTSGEIVPHRCRRKPETGKITS